MSTKNCTDLKTIHSVYFEPREGQRKWECQSFASLRGVAGQLMRWAITIGTIEQTDGWEKGALADCLSDLDTVRAFVNYFTITAAPNTVSLKANNMKIMNDFLRPTVTDEKKGCNMAQVAT